MRFKHIALVTLAVLLASALLSSLTAYACEPTDPASLQCDNWRPPRINPTPKPVSAVPAKPSPTAIAVANMTAGTYPDAGFEPNDKWQVIAPNAIVWYKIGSGINPQRLEVWADSNGKEGISLIVYAPEQYNQIWTDAPPKGRGSPNKLLHHDLYWVGQSPEGGTWYIMITNAKPVPMDYKVGYNRVEAPRKSCDSYWESIYGSPVYWTACQ